MNCPNCKKESIAEINLQYHRELVRNLEYRVAEGRQSMIYQCDVCGQLCEFSTMYNEHKRTHDPKWENVQYGYADPPEWKEVDCKESDILEADPK